jgi:hypothetical protein
MAIINDTIALIKETLKPHLLIIFLLISNMIGIGANAAVFITDVCHPFNPIDFCANGICPCKNKSKPK